MGSLLPVIFYPRSTAIYSGHWQPAFECYFTSVATIAPDRHFIQHQHQTWGGGKACSTRIGWGGSIWSTFVAHSCCQSIMHLEGAWQHYTGHWQPAIFMLLLFYPSINWHLIHVWSPAPNLRWYCMANKDGFIMPTFAAHSYCRLIHHMDMGSMRQHSTGHGWPAFPCHFTSLATGSW